VKVVTCQLMGFLADRSMVALRPAYVTVLRLCLPLYGMYCG